MKTTVWLRILALFLMTVIAMTFISSEEQINLGSAGASSSGKHYITDFQRSCARINDNINQKIFDLPMVYTLPMDQSPSPLPDPDGFTKDSYKDSTISVNCWRERINISKKTVTANFAEITIAHPSQLRTAFAGGQFGTKRMLASRIAKNNNAVVAVNADFYNYNSNGVIIRNGTLYREKPYGKDLLLIDSKGNFIIMSDHAAKKDGYYKNNKITQSFSFGPALVNDGKALKKFGTNYACGPYGNNPRTAVGQIGPLHYLLCTVDGRMDNSRGVNMAELSQIMLRKNCTVAYNMDGGQSSVLYFHNKPYNHVADGGERTLSDILYFATAIPESERQ